MNDNRYRRSRTWGGLATSVFIIIQERTRPYPSDEQGYQRPPTPSVPGTYQEGGQLYAYPTQPEQQSDQPQAQPSQQEEALLHQH